MPPSARDQKPLKQVGEQIRKARLEKGVSLRKFAEVVSLTPSYFSKLERGEALAGSETYERICQELGLDRDAVMVQLRLVDPKTEELVREHYLEVKAYLRKIAKKEE